MAPERRFIGSFAASWALHAALALAAGGWLLGGVEPPSLTVLELVGSPDSGPVSSTAPPRPSPPRPRVTVPLSDARRAPPAPAPVVPEVGQADRARPPLALDGGGAEPARTPRADVGDGAAGREGSQLTGPGAGYQTIPRYPESARRVGAQGTTVLRVRVLADGSVGEIVVDRSAGHADLDAAAVSAVRRWRFEPARRGGEPVAVWVLIPIRFTLG